MPIITPNAKDILMGKVVDPAWYRVRIDSVGEAPSSDGGSTNYPVEATILRNADTGETAFTGVPLRWNFNSKFISAALTYLQCFGVEIEADKRYELSNSEGKELDVFVENAEWQGRIINRVNHKYRPAK